MTGHLILWASLVFIFTLITQEPKKKEEVRPYTNFEQAQRIVRLSLDLCWEDMARGSVTYGYAEPSISEYLWCVKNYLDKMGKKSDEGTLFEDPDTDLKEPQH